MYIYKIYIESFEFFTNLVVSNSSFLYIKAFRNIGCAYIKASPNFNRGYELDTASLKKGAVFSLIRY